MEWLSLKSAASFLSILCIIYILTAYNNSFLSIEKVFNFVPFRYLYQDEKKIELFEDDVKNVIKSSRFIFLFVSFLVFVFLPQTLFFGE